MVSSNLQQKIRENKRSISSLTDTSHFAVQNAVTYDQYESVMISIQKELDAIISNEKVIANRKDNKQEIISQVFLSPEASTLNTSLDTLQQEITDTHDQLEKLQINNKASSSIKQDEMDRQISKLTTQIELE